jgi:hypothetical protein
LKVICKRTYFTEYPVGSKKELLFEKNRSYNILDHYKMINKLVLTIETSNILINTWSFSENEFNKYFIGMDELRDNKINEILKR